MVVWRLGQRLRDSLEILCPTPNFFWIRKTGAIDVNYQDNKFVGLQWKFHGLLMFSNNQFPRSQKLTQYVLESLDESLTSCMTLGQLGFFNPFPYCVMHMKCPS